MRLLTKATATIVLTATLTLGGAAPIIPTQVEAKAGYVIIAPNHGKKYHYTKSCRGLNNAGRLKFVTKKWARAHHYKLCKWEY